MENRKDQKPDIQKEAVWILKSLLGAYVVTGILLLLLALFVYKLNLEEKQVTVAVMAIYLVSTFVGGFMIGKWNRVQKFLWGNDCWSRLFYFTIACLFRYISFIEKRWGKCSYCDVFVSWRGIAWRDAGVNGKP